MSKSKDDYNILKSTLKDYADTYATTFGVRIEFSNDGKVVIYDDSFQKERDITVAELKLLITNYEKLEATVNELTKKTNISFDKPLKTSKSNKNISKQEGYGDNT